MRPVRRLPPMTALRVLEAIHETGSVTAAARRLSVSHSAVSHQVKQLEAWVGRPIFVRRGRTLMLTPAGESLAGVVNEAFDSIRHEIDRLPAREARTVTVAALPIVATRVLLPGMGRFPAGDVRLHLSLSHADRPFSPAPDAEILFKPRESLLDDDVPFLPGNAVAVASTALLAGGAEALLAEGPLLADEDLRMWQRWAEEAGRDPAALPAPHLIVEGAFLLQEAALAGLGVAICRTALMGEDLRAGRLVQVAETEIDADWCYLVRTAPGRRAEPEVRAVIAWIQSLAEDAP